MLAATRRTSTDSTQLGSLDLPLPTDALPNPDGLAPTFIHQLRSVPYIRSDLDEKTEPSCQKLLFSATLTRDPSKIAALNLKEPKYFVVQGTSGEAPSKEENMMDLVMEKFSMPASLTEHMIVCESAQKPLMLFYLAHKHGVRNALVFTKSAESTARLVKLFEFFESIRSAASGTPADSVISLRAYSSDLPASERKTILDKFKGQEIHM